MTADEIRMASVCLREIETDAVAYIQAGMMFEIAAQLAELNANLREIFNSDQKFPKLYVDKLE